MKNKITSKKKLAYDPRGKKVLLFGGPEPFEFLPPDISRSTEERVTSDACQCYF